MLISAYLSMFFIMLLFQGHEVNLMSRSSEINHKKPKFKSLRMILRTRECVREREGERERERDSSSFGRQLHNQFEQVTEPFTGHLHNPSDSLSALYSITKRASVGAFKEVSRDRKSVV